MTVAGAGATAPRAGRQLDESGSPVMRGEHVTDEQYAAGDQL